MSRANAGGRGGSGDDLQGPCQRWTHRQRDAVRASDGAPRISTVAHFSLSSGGRQHDISNSIITAAFISPPTIMCRYNRCDQRKSHSVLTHLT